MKPPCNHADPSTFVPSRGSDGRVRMMCPNCRKFMGYAPPTTAKGKPKSRI